MLHGGDYNPDQWRATPEVWDADVRLLGLAGCNAMSLGIFAWSALEPREGEYEFGWLDTVMDKLAAAGAYAVLATPSGSKPAWLSRAYPEVCRVRADGLREFHGGRHNHCRTSPVYREKCIAVNMRLAQRYRDHPALLLWHVSNEYNGGECYCGLCLEAFRAWLRVRYGGDLDALNRAWWSGFWSHSYSDWGEVRPGDGSIHGMSLDWKRFISDQTIDFFRAESAPLREVTPEIPVTTNFMGLYTGLNYWDFARAVDVVAWDSYPRWHDSEDDVAIAVETAFVHDMYRSMKGGRPFMLMESVPSTPTRGDVRKRKRPGMHLLSSLQAVAHGSDTVQYFQWRKGRGGCEKFHGAVVDHVGHENTRVFQDVVAVGRALAKLDDVVGTTIPADVALLYDWENRWAVEAAIGLGQNVRYEQTCVSHYRPFWEMGIGVDVIDQTCDLSKYKLVLAPMLYMLRPGIAERLSEFVKTGGTLVGTYWSGIVDEHDLCFLGGFPGGGLRDVFGIWDEELDVLQDFDRNGIVMCEDNSLGLRGRFAARDLCSRIHAESAEVLATYSADFYAGEPALTVNGFGRGRAYYIASRNAADFIRLFSEKLVDDLAIARVLDTALPHGVTAQMRTDGDTRFVFLMNFGPEPVETAVGAGPWRDMLSGAGVNGSVQIEGFGVRVLARG